MIRIFHVDDCADDIHIAKFNLEQLIESVEYHQFLTARDILESLEENSCDCILSDYKLAAMNGLQLLRELRVRGNEIPFIFLTGQGNEEIAAEAFRLGAADYFTKEIGFAHYDRLANSIRRVIEARKDRDARQRAIQALRISEEKLSKAFEVIPDSITISSLKDGCIVEANRGFEILSGYSREEALGRSSFELDLWDNHQDRDRLIHEIKTRGSVKQLRTDYRSKDGHLIRGLSSMLPIEIEGEKYLVTIVRDILSEYEAVRKAQAEKLLSDSLLEAQMDTVFVFEPATGRPLRWNSVFREISGYSDDEIASMKVPDALFYQEDLDTASEALTAIFKEGGATVELPLKTKNGDRIPFEYKAALVETVEGDPLVISIGRNIAGRKRSEEKLAESREWFRQLVKTAHVIILCLTPDYKVIGFNPEAERVYGKTRAEVLNKDYLQLFVPENDRGRVRADIDKVLNGEPARGFENEIICANGERARFAWNVDRMVDVQGKPTGVLAVGVDIS